MNQHISVVLVAGGIGTRMGAPIPKQFLILQDKPIVMHAFELFQNIPYVKELVIVCPLDYRYLFTTSRPDITLSFALPGERRQDSVYNGVQVLSPDSSIVCIHDGVRPFITEKMVSEVIQAAIEHGAATLGTPVKFTVKEGCSNHFVKTTLDRSKLWEIQTPQAIQTPLLKRSFDYAYQNGLSVTDDASLVELLGHSVKIVPGSYANIKITTPEDLAMSHYLCSLK